MNAQQAISIFVGAALSVILQAIPPVKAYWERQVGKTLILLTLHLGGALLLWLLDCRAGVSTYVTMTCNYEGFLNMAWNGTLAFTSNQATYGLTNYAAPAAYRIANQAYSHIRRL